MKKVLVTGADGFIGSHLVESLLEKGYEVKAFTMYNSFNTWGWLDALPKDKLDQIEIFSGDVRDPNGVREALKGMDGIFHLAALIAIPFSYHSPDSYVDTNIKGTLNVLQAARELGTERIMITSTSEVYGTAPRSHERDTAKPAYKSRQKQQASPNHICNKVGKINIPAGMAYYQFIADGSVTVFGTEEHTDKHRNQKSDGKVINKIEHIQRIRKGSSIPQRLPTIAQHPQHSIKQHSQEAYPKDLVTF